MHQPETGHPGRRGGLRALSRVAIASDRAIKAAFAQGANLPSRDRLIAAARDAARALRLRGAPRIILEKLAAVYGGEPVKDRVIVWPSNRWLTEASGLDERSVRRAIAALISAGLVVAKDSPSRARYARRDPANGQVADAFGLDLTPLWLRRGAFAGELARRDMERRALAAADVELSRMALAIRSALEAAEPFDVQGARRPLARRFAELMAQVPRRGQQGERQGLLAALQEVRDAAEGLFYDLSAEEGEMLISLPNSQNESGSAGQSVPPKEKHFDHSTESVSAGDAQARPPAQQERASGAQLSGEEKGREAAQAGRREGAAVPLSALLRACPAIADLGRPLRSVADLEDLGALVRPWFGASPDAWAEGVETIGRALTAALSVYVYQLAADDAELPLAKQAPRGAHGGLYRSLIRKTAKGEFDLAMALLERCRKSLS